MKKYIMPTIREMVLTEQEMIAASVEGFVSTLDTETEITADQMLTRRNSVWGDDEE